MLTHLFRKDSLPYKSSPLRIYKSLFLLISISLLISCDQTSDAMSEDDQVEDIGSAGSAGDEVESDFELDLGVAGSVEDMRTDISLGGEEFVFNLPPCLDSSQGSYHPSGGDLVLNDRVIFSWPADSVVRLEASQDGSISEMREEGDLLYFSVSCEDQISSIDNRVQLTPVAQVRPMLQEDERYWKWRRPATLNFEIPEELGVISRDELELWWWPFKPLETLQNSNTLAEFGDAKRLMMRDPIWDESSRRLIVSIDEWGAYMITRHQGNQQSSPSAPRYRGLIGVSMGGGASAQLGARNPELFDFVAALGGASDWLYMLHYVTDRLLGGFCLDERRGEFCGTGPVTEPKEQYADFLNFIYTENGALFNRDFYVKVFQDVVLALGNPTTYSAESPYLPPGILVDELLRSKRDRCQTECRGERCDPPQEWLSLNQFYDREFNPDGAFPVIPFCDGDTDEGFEAQWSDAYHDKPTDLLLAVDYNQNGRRDRDEPIIVNTSEPFEDLGCDGLKDEDEPGYHPLLNPDPNGDNFHWLYQPFGSEGDHLFQGADGQIGLEQLERLPRSVFNLERNPIADVRDFLTRFACKEGEPGEPFDDYGLDGIPFTLSIEEGGFDWGEGNGQFDYNPHKINFITANPAFWLERALSLDRSPRFWIDGGIRDAMNFLVAGMRLAGRVHALSDRPMTLFDSFDTLLGTEFFVPQNREDDPLNGIGQHVLFRYGNPDASPEEIASGDGAHVGTDKQAVGRVNGALHWMMKSWKAELGDLPPVGITPARTVSESFESVALGGRYHFEIVLPPGYSDESNRDRRYPIIFFQHGYGQYARNLTVSNVVFNGLMGAGIWPPTLFVYPDGACSDMVHFACNDGVDNDGDSLIDLDDPGCRGNERRRVEDDEPENDNPQRCQDGIDNDRDGLIDLDDPGCLSADYDDEGECRTGTFFLPHIVNVDGVTSGRDYEGAFLDMIRYIDQKYRTLAGSSEAP